MACDLEYSRVNEPPCNHALSSVWSSAASPISASCPLHVLNRCLTISAHLSNRDNARWFARDQSKRTFQRSETRNAVHKYLHKIKLAVGSCLRYRNWYTRLDQGTRRPSDANLEQHAGHVSRPIREQRAFICAIILLGPIEESERNQTTTEGAALVQPFRCCPPLPWRHTLRTWRVGNWLGIKVKLAGSIARERACADPLYELRSDTALIGKRSREAARASGCLILWTIRRLWDLLVHSSQGTTWYAAWGDWYLDLFWYEAYRDIPSREIFVVLCAQEEAFYTGEVWDFGEELMGALYVRNRRRLFIWGWSVAAVVLALVGDCTGDLFGCGRSGGRSIGGRYGIRHRSSMP